MNQLNQPSNLLLNKDYYTIGEIANYCGLKPYVLRYWEQEFASLQPIKRNKRRYYQQNDLRLIMRLKQLLHGQGYSIQGAKNLLEKEGQMKPAINHQKNDIFVLQKLHDVSERLDNLQNTIQVLKQFSY